MVIVRRQYLFSSFAFILGCILQKPIPSASWKVFAEGEIKATQDRQAEWKEHMEVSTKDVLEMLVKIFEILLRIENGIERFCKGVGDTRED